MSNYSNISRWLKSGEYRSLIDSVLTKIVRNCELSNSEADTSSIFEREIYYLVRSQLGIELSFSKESPIEGIVHKFEGLSSRKSGHGRLDAVVNNIIIEYKHHTKLTTEKQITSAFEQVKDYLIAIDKNENIRYDAILTDGIKVAYFQFIGDVVRNTALRTITVDDIDRIVKAILNNQSKKFDPSNIVKDFSISPKSLSVSKKIAKILYNQLTSDITEKSEMLYSEWKELMHLSVADNGKSNDIAKRRKDLSLIFDCNISNTETEYKALFALQTTYAIIVKLIACKVVDKLNFNEETHEYHDLSVLAFDKTQKFFQKMEDGYSYTSLEIRNFLEGDFFSWYADSSQWSEGFWKDIREIIKTLDDYSSFSLNVKYNPIDIFKDLYMSIIPQSVRHSMGEYFTPEWLADCVVTEALTTITKTQWTAIDPCCGSGIFIIALIKKVVGNIDINELSKSQRKELLNSILNRVHGIDINPLSVLSARVSYYIAIQQFCEVEDVEIPIFLGDSAIVPIRESVDGVDCYRYAINNNKFGQLKVLLPVSFVNKADFGKNMSNLQALVKAESPEALYKSIIQGFSEEEKSSVTLMESVKKLAVDLVKLHKNKWDGIWIRITTNFMLIARLQKHDLIVGNPPWVKWEHLPSAYTKKIKEFCNIRHIFCNDGMYGGAQLNICALISNVAATNWLHRNGILAFLMPDSLMSQNSYEEFRNFYIDDEKKERLYLQKLDRWCAPLRPFKVGKKSVSQDFNTYYYSSQFVDYKDGVKVRSISKKDKVNDLVINNCASFIDAEEYLDIKEVSARQLAENSTQFTYVSARFDFSAIIGDTFYNYRTGVESTPFEVFKMVGVGCSNQPNHYRFKNKILKASKYKVDNIPVNGWDFPVELLYPMIEGPAITPYSVNWDNNFHIIPYNQDNTSLPIPLDKLLESNEELATYFCKHKELLEQQSDKSKNMHRGKEFYALSKIGPYTFAPFIVAARDNSNFCSSVIRPVHTPWGELKQAICVKHTIIISQDIKGNFISEDESHYINAILNSTIVRSYIHATFKTNGFSLKKSNLCMPKFDSSNRLHSRLAILSRIATLPQNAEKRERISDLSSYIYIQVCTEYKSM
ncbi:Eco57I restriction-modification methylase domain-containing protein [Porphyromonas canoris]|uniref:site-specific DNA-methyltransferase (adenine-specific) n=1 Tax=Porphyromonas canoris TaxID=36875 RepID=A0ABR4XKU0_9PORP|nr:N-6 DNA methylase [Porphyromonas canoris]KGN92442.1 hypothetical protein HQ43_05320 [Porphyromonas canoris]